MEFRIADTFTASLARLTGDEQKAIKTTAFDLQMNPANPGMQFHRLDKARDKNFWSVRVNSDIRLIVHKSEASLLLCFVDHHDKAYLWAERRKLEVHPRTGAAQLVEIRERVEEIVLPLYVEKDVSVSRPPAPKPLLFAKYAEEDLLQYGVPPEWIPDVLMADEDSLLRLADHLPAEASEALLELATGGTPVAFSLTAPSKASPFDHPDAQRRFRVLHNVEELEQALAYPWEKWIYYLHPGQRSMVERDYSGPVRVSGSAGTGKTIVALHRAAFLARKHPDARVMLTTLSEPLANALRGRLIRLIASEPRLGERLEVHSLPALGRRLFELNIGKEKVAAREEVAAMLKDASAKVPGHSFRLPFLRNEWDQIVDAWQVETWEAYRDVKRLGRKTRLPEKQREILWTIFQDVRAGLSARRLVTPAQMFTRLAAALEKGGKPPFEFAVVDECQDLKPAQLRYLASMGRTRPNCLFFAGDLGQRIFGQPFSWKSLGVEVRGRSTTLKVNYRTSHQIRSRADGLLSPEIADVDGNKEERKGTVSVFNGPAPIVSVYPDPESEIQEVSQWIAARAKEGYTPQEIGVFVRSEAELERAIEAAGRSGLKFRVLDKDMEVISGHVSIGTMHLAKGLEFRAVAVMACDDEILPNQTRIDSVGDESDLEEVYDTERHLLYVACTRARDQLLVTCGGESSEFLLDLRR